MPLTALNRTQKLVIQLSILLAAILIPASIVFIPAEASAAAVIQRLIVGTKGLFLVILVVIILGILYHFFKKVERTLPKSAITRRSGISTGAVVGLVIAILFIVIVGSLTGSTFVSVKAGEASIIRNTYEGELRVGPMGPIDAPWLKSPFFEDVVHVNIAVDNVYMWSKYDDNFNEISHGDWEAPIGFTTDGIKMAFDVNFFFRVSPNATTAYCLTPAKLQQPCIINLYLNYPNLDYKDRVIVPIVRQVVRDVMANETFDNVIAQRQALPAFIANEVVSKVLSNPTLKGVIQVDPSSFQILEIHMPKVVQDQLQAKKNSEIAIITAGNQRQTTIINADAQRQQQVLQAQGLAEAKLISANATARSIELVLQSVCPPANSSACIEQAGQLYLQLLMYKDILSITGSNVLFFIGQSGGQPIIYQIPNQNYPDAP